MSTVQGPVLHGVCAGAARVVPVGVAQRPRPRPLRRQHQTLQSRRGARRGRGGEVGPCHVSRVAPCHVSRVQELDRRRDPHEDRQRGHHLWPQPRLRAARPPGAAALRGHPGGRGYIQYYSIELQMNLREV